MENKIEIVQHVFKMWISLLREYIKWNPIGVLLCGFHMETQVVERLKASSHRNGNVTVMQTSEGGSFFHYFTMRHQISVE
jgi:hypothetical protein